MRGTRGCAQTLEGLAGLKNEHLENKKQREGGQQYKILTQNRCPGDVGSCNTFAAVARI